MAFCQRHSNVFVVFIVWKNNNKFTGKHESVFVLGILQINIIFNFRETSVFYSGKASRLEFVGG